MIPPQWQPYVRVEDGELLGYLVPAATGLVPVTLFGYPLAGPADRTETEAVLRARGLPVLAEPWYLDTGDGDPVKVTILSAYADRVVVVQTEYGLYGPDSPRFEVPVPDDGRLSLSRRR